jgi:hypothetical protein
MWLIFTGMQAHWEVLPDFAPILFVMLCVLTGGWLGWMYHFILVVKTYDAGEITFNQHCIELEHDKSTTALLSFVKRIAMLNTARLIAREYAESGNTLLSYAASDIDEVRLVTISTDVPPTREILPFRFREYLPDIPYNYTVILLHPDDWNLVVSGELKLPNTYENPLVQVWPLPTNENSDLVLAR